MTPPPASTIGRTFSLYPTARGFGWVAFDGPLNLVEFGLFTVKGKNKNAVCLAQLEKLLGRLKPETLVLEAFDEHSSIRSPRIRRFCVTVVALAADGGLDLAVFKRRDVQAAFAVVGARTRHEIALAIARQFPGLRYLEPKDRKNGDSEDKRLSIFNAAALVLTHFHFGTFGLFKELRGAA